MEKLSKELETQQQEKEALEASASEAEKKISELNFKLADLEKINVEQKSEIRNTKRALKIAEEELIKTKSEDISKAKELMDVTNWWICLPYHPSFMFLRTFQMLYLKIANEELIKTKSEDISKAKELMEVTN